MKIPLSCLVVSSGISKPAMHNNSKVQSSGITRQGPKHFFLQGVPPWRPSSSLPLNHSKEGKQNRGICYADIWLCFALPSYNGFEEERLQHWLLCPLPMPPPLCTLTWQQNPLMLPLLMFLHNNVKILCRSHNIVMNPDLQLTYL